MAKLYTKNTWTDEVLAGDERYNILDDNGDPIESAVQIELATDVAQAGTAVDADKMNNIENGIDAIDDRLDDLDGRVNDLETGIESGMVDYSDTSTIVGWGSFSIKEILYKKVGPLVFVVFRLTGVSNSDSTSFTLPFTRAGTHSVYTLTRARDNSGDRTVGMAIVGSNPDLAVLSPNLASNTWTASGTKESFGQFVYVADE